MTPEEEELFFLEMEERNAKAFINGPKVKKGKNESVAWPGFQIIYPDFEISKKEN